MPAPEPLEAELEEMDADAQPEEWEALPEDGADTTDGGFALGPEDQLADEEQPMEEEAWVDADEVPAEVEPDAEVEVDEVVDEFLFGGTEDKPAPEDDGQQPEEEHEAEEEEEPEEQEEEAQNHPEREDDLKLEDLPEDQRLAIEGNMKLKKMLEHGPESAAKRRKTDGVVAETPLDPLRACILAKWKLSHDSAVRYVLEAADTEDVEALRDSKWAPATANQQKTFTEQVSNKLGFLREQLFPPCSSVNAIEAFIHRWKLKGQVKSLLLSLNHKDLRYVMTRFSSGAKLEELVDEAAMAIPAEVQEKAEDAAPQQPGLLTIGRFNRLELIDPSADALVVGDANLTFSLLLAQHREGLGHVGRTVATTFETIEILRERYPEIDTTVKTLEDKLTEVLHNVDCTRLAVDPRFKEMSGKFGAVYYNFPHAGVVQGFFDGHPFVRWRHENLMHLFFSALRIFVAPGGVVKVSSNSRATGVRFTDIIGAAVQNEFTHVETVPFLEWQLRNYRRSYGDRRDAGRRPDDGEVYRNQRGDTDMVYCFRYDPSGKPHPKPTVRSPPTKQILLESKEGKLSRMKPEEKNRRVQEIYDLFLTYVQGIHVG